MTRRRRLAGALLALASWAAARVHASGVEAYLDLRVHGMQHLVDYALATDGRGEHLLLWFVPDLASPLPHARVGPAQNALMRGSCVALLDSHHGHR